MQIYSTSPTHSFSNNRGSHNRRGFTLVELLVCIGIIGLLTAIILVRYTSFDSTVLLKGEAYEVALAVRDAQVKSVSAVRSSTDAQSAKYPFGVTFTPGEKSYKSFQYNDPDPENHPYYDVPESNPDVAHDVFTFTLERTMQIYDVCVTDENDNETCSISRLDISFRRPEYRALFFAQGFSGTQENIRSAKIKVNSTNGSANVFVVEVSSMGQISVLKE